MNPKTCCVTGHRQIPIGKSAYVEAMLREKITAAIRVGYRHFVYGGVEGADLLFASIIAEMKAGEYPLTLEAAIPYAGRLQSRDVLFQKMLSASDKVTVLCENYDKECFFTRNRYMVDISNAVIGVYDGRKTGGTYYTLRYAREQNKTIRLIRI